jgi:3-methylcrotonyl-CoA carboxylase alpha subunit
MQPASMQMLALAAAALLESERNRFGATGDPWSDTSGWRMNGSSERTLDFHDEQNVYSLTVQHQAGHVIIRHGAGAARMRLVEHAVGSLSIMLDDDMVRGTVVREADVFHVFTGGAHRMLAYKDPLADAGQIDAEDSHLTAPMPGKILAVLAGTGDKVKKGVPLLIMEAMKMEHTIVAPANGVIESVMYAVGDQVAEGAQLLTFKTD